MLKIELKYDANIHYLPPIAVVTGATCFNIQIICIYHRICIHMMFLSKRQLFKKCSMHT
jgi:hypothetical protein